jgi:PAS domain S-box-containing protein
VVQEPARIPAEAPVSERLITVLDDIPALVAVLRGPDLVVEFANARRDLLVGADEVLGRPLRDLLGPLADRPEFKSYADELRHVLETGETIRGWESPARLPGTEHDSFWDYAMIPLRDPGQPPVGVVVHSVEVTRLVEARSRAEALEHRFTTLFEANVIGVTISRLDQVLEANDAFLQIVGRTREDVAAGLSWVDITPPESRAADERAMEQIRRDGGAPPYEKEYLRPDGTRVPVLISGSRLASDPLVILATAYDLSERHSVEAEIAVLLERERDARFAAELAGARTSRLQEITAHVSATNAADEIARTIVLHALEDLSASACMLVRASGELSIGHAVGFRPEDVERWRRFPATMPTAVEDALGTGAPVLLRTPAAITEACPELAGAGAVAAVPLEVTGRILGVLLLSFREARDLTREDRDFLVALARQAAAALDRAELFENRAYVARKLQEGLLPQRLDEIPGATSAIVYESISGGGEVGGDFYDLFENGLGGWALAVGDVCGKGTEAAVVTGLARHTLRAIARVHSEPDAVLEFLNGALRRHGGQPAFCTVAFGVIDPDPAGGFTVRLSSGGHPYPVVVRRDGTLEEVEVTGTMLGVADDPQLESLEVRVGPGDAIVMYTDGVLDARLGGGERFGEERLFAALRGAAGGSADGLASAVEAAVREHHPGASADDRAILVVRAT